MSAKFLVIRFLAVITTAGCFFVSCDDDISEVGADVLIDSQLEITTESNFGVNLSPIDINDTNIPQTNNLEYYLLGDKSNGFTDTKYSIVATFLGLENPPENTNTEITIDDETTITVTTNKITSARLAIPYIYTNEIDNEAVDSETAIYSISKTEKGTSDLEIEVFNINYELQVTDPNNGLAQKYFANGTSTFGEQINLTETNLIGSGSIVVPETDAEDNEFEVNLFNDEEDVSLESFEINQGLEEIIRIDLNDEFIDVLNGLIDGNENGVDVFNTIDLYEVLGSIYIKTSNTTGGVVGVMEASSAFYTGGIELVFETNKQVTVDGELDEDESTTDDDDEADWITTSTLLFVDNPINILTENSSVELISSETDGRIILQSGLGGIGKVELFNDNDELKEDDNDGIETLFEKNTLLNDAVLRFTVDVSIFDSALTNSEIIELLPENIFISELNTGGTLSDYLNNFSSNDEDNETLKEGHLMSLVAPSDGDVFFDPYYEINITVHLANILRQDSGDEAIIENISLALSITEDLNIVGVSQLNDETDEQFINQGSLLSFKTLALFGSNATDIENRPRLTIKYTSTK